MISKIVNIEDVYSFLTDFYSCDYDDLPFFQKRNCVLWQPSGIRKFSLNYSPRILVNLLMREIGALLLDIINEL